MNNDDMKLLTESNNEKLKKYVVMKEYELYKRTRNSSGHDLSDYEYQYESGEDTKYIMFDDLKDAKNYYNDINVKYDMQGEDLYNQYKEIIQIDNYQKLNKENQTLEDVLSDGEYKQLHSVSAKEKEEEVDNLSQEIFEWYDSDMGNHFDDIQGNEEENMDTIHNALAGYNKDILGIFKNDLIEGEDPDANRIYKLLNQFMQRSYFDDLSENNEEESKISPEDEEEDER